MAKFCYYFSKKTSIFLFCLSIIASFYIYSGLIQPYSHFSLTYNLEDNPNNHKEEIKKYVIYQCVDGMLCGGWGDRLKGIFAAYAWALLSDRIFLIHHTKPCLLTNMLEPNQIKWNHPNFSELLKTKKVEELYRVDHGYFKDQIKNFKLDDFKNRSSIIVIKNNLDWLEPIAANPNTRSKLIELGYEPDKFKMQFLFHKWYSNLFKLTKNLDEKYQEFLKRAKPNKDSLLICAQVRIGGSREHVSNDENFTQRNNTVIYWNHIRNVFIQNNTNYMIFLTTDTKQIEDEARKEFGNDKIIINDGINAHLDRESNLGSNCSKIEKTFLDFHSLQNCDKAIISESGFGKFK